MIAPPFRFEPNLSPDEFQKIGQLSLRWSLTEHIIGNCLRVMLRLTEPEAAKVVFPLGLERKIKHMTDLAEIIEMTDLARERLDEVAYIMPGVQYVRNNVIHAIIIPDDVGGEHLFHLRSKGRSLTKTEVFSAEELTNYAGHAVIALRLALGGKDDPAGMNYTLPETPEIPEFLRLLIPTRKK